MIGNLLTGLFAQKSVAGFDGITIIPGGWLDHHYVQLAMQLADSASGMAYSFVVTTVILWIMHFTPGLRLRVTEEEELMGIDDVEMGEFAYDYVGIDLDLAQASGLKGEHLYKDDTHTHGDLPNPSGGREPHHVHVSVVPKDGSLDSAVEDKEAPHA